MDNHLRLPGCGRRHSLPEDGRLACERRRVSRRQSIALRRESRLAGSYNVQRIFGGKKLEVGDFFAGNPQARVLGTKGALADGKRALKGGEGLTNLAARGAGIAEVLECGGDGKVIRG